MSKKVIVGGIASILVVACVVAACVTLTKHGDDTSSDTVSTSTKSVETMCQPTPYKQTCEKTLSAAKNVSDPKDYIKVTFEATVEDIKNAIMNTEPIKRAASDPYTKDALLACEELFDLAVEDLRGSVMKLENFDITKIKDMVDDLKTWLSAVVTYEETCLDAFSKTEQGETREKMVKLLNTTREMSINGLAMVNEFGVLITQSTGLTRKLLTTSSDHDSFVEASNRKLLQTSNVKPNVVVAQDGSGQYKSIKEAINMMPLKNAEPYVILIKAGTYKEQVIIEKNATNIVFMGEGPSKTIISGDKGVKNGGNITTWHTCSLCVASTGMVIRDIGIENTAGIEKEQAVALRVNADKVVIYNCNIDGFQDTLYAHTYRQFYRDNTITGTIDFIFGDASAVFQNCKLIVRKPGHNQACMITAQGRTQPTGHGGFVIQNCEIKAEPAFTSTQPPIKAYLGRPWKEYSRTIIMQSFIDGFIDPTGWAPWNQSDFGLHTSYYAEYQNRGPGATLDKRISTWKGYQKGISGDAINKFTANEFINTETPWLPKDGIPYEAGMMKV